MGCLKSGNDFGVAFGQGKMPANCCSDPDHKENHVASLQADLFSPFIVLP